MTNIPTAEEFLVSPQSREIADNLSQVSFKLAHTTLMIEFAKIHVEAALKAAHSNMQLPDEDLEFTLGAYPLTNIK